MATKNEIENGSAAAGTEAYEKALRDYGTAVERMQRGGFAEARELFLAVVSETTDEPELAERARTYARICERRTAEPAPAPRTPEDCLHRAVFLVNEGKLDEAIAVLDPVLAENPTSVDHLYVRASSWAMKGVVDRAVADLRQAILVDPTVRFQAINDVDFERIREEPSFIDIIEPTHDGA